MKQKKDNSKDMLFEMMRKVGGMSLNENYPAGADEDPNAPWNEPDEDEEINEPDPDEYRDDDIEENSNDNDSLLNQYKKLFVLAKDRTGGNSLNEFEKMLKKLFPNNYTPPHIIHALSITDNFDEFKKMIGLDYDQLSENNSYLPLDKNKFFYDKRYDKIVQITSVDGNDIIAQYYDNKKNPTETKEYKKSEIDYWIEKGAWEEWKQDVKEGWGKNIVAGGLATAASLGGMSGAQAQQTASNEPAKQGTENVDKTQQETFYNIMIGIAKYKDTPRSTIEAKKVYNEIMNYFSALKEGKTPSELSHVAKNTVKKWYDMIKSTDNSMINTLIQLGQSTAGTYNTNNDVSI